MVEDKMQAVQRYSAFTQVPHGGNPAGVVLTAEGWSDHEMQQVATAVGYSETAFVTGKTPDGFEVRYFSPASEVPFCGHATIALAVALAEQGGTGERILLTRSGRVPVVTAIDPHGVIQATLTSVEPRVSEPTDEELNQALSILGWSRGDLHPDLPPRVSYAGAAHLILVAKLPERLQRFSYDYPKMKALVDRSGWITIHCAWPRQMPHLHDVRNVFPAFPVLEDPATGASAAAYGAYLRHLGAVTPPLRLELRQGEAMGRPSVLFVDIPKGNAGIRVSGPAISITAS